MLNPWVKCIETEDVLSSYVASALDKVGCQCDQ